MRTYPIMIVKYFAENLHIQIESKSCEHVLAATCNILFLPLCSVGVKSLHDLLVDKAACF